MTRSLISCSLIVALLLVSFGCFGQSQKAIDDNLIKSYLEKNQIKATKTASGLYYTVTQKGTGGKARFGKKVTMNYLGKFLDGKKFDANVDDNFQPIHPFSFVLGVGQVIQGWDEGVQLLTIGSKATFFLPSAIGYGAKSVGPIPPNSVLVFDVELVSQDK